MSYNDDDKNYDYNITELTVSKDKRGNLIGQVQLLDGDAFAYKNIEWFWMTQQ